MPERCPSVFLLVPGPWPDVPAIVSALAAGGVVADPTGDGPIAAGQVRVERIVSDGIADAFTWGRRGRLADPLVARIRHAPSAALLEVGHLLHEKPGLLARIGRSLQAGGGVAIRTEGSGAAIAWPEWLAACDAGDSWSMADVSVLVVGDEGGGAFTCGMHMFGHPDVQVPFADLHESRRWLDALCAYQILEDPTLLSGHTFAPDADTPRHDLERWPDGMHDPEDGRHNPLGVWRVLSDGAPALQMEAPVHFIPSLAALLMARERAKGDALTEAEVEEVVARATCITVEPAHVIQLERARGYVDIEPRRAWAQWKLIRRQD